MWLRFQMVDEKSVMDQIHEYENLVANVLSEPMKMCKILHTNVLFDKFPLFWSDNWNYLKHKKKGLTLKELISHMRIEEANRLKNKQNSTSSMFVKANLVKSSSTPIDKSKNKGKKVMKDKPYKKGT